MEGGLGADGGEFVLCAEAAGGLPSRSPALEAVTPLPPGQRCHTSVRPRVLIFGAFDPSVTASWLQMIWWHMSAFISCERENRTYMVEADVQSAMHRAWLLEGIL